MFSLLIPIAKPLVIEDVEVAPPKKDEVRIKVL
jgi:Zn-dependent alcohol dehydrogenase